MKKLLMAILILIPLIVLGTVTLAGGIASVAAHIGVDSVTIYLKDNIDKEDGIIINLDDVSDKTVSVYEYLDTEVLPEKATNPTVIWSVTDIRILDAEYEKMYQYYIHHKDDPNVIPVIPPVCLVDEEGRETENNTTGNMVINAYCTFTMKAMAEQHSDIVTVSIVGYDVRNVTLSFEGESFKTGDTAKINLNCIPVDSIITKTEWSSSDENIAVVDSNGIVTAKKNGTVTIRCRAYKYTVPDEYAEGKIVLDIKTSVTYFGQEIYSHLESLSLSELGINEVTSLIGGTLAGDIVSFDSDVMIIGSPAGSVSVKKCNAGDIKINEASVVGRETGYVLSVSDNILQLTCGYVSSFKNEVINPVWSSSDEEIATINSNGLMSFKKNGFVTISAEYGGHKAEINLNIQNKISSLTLLTSDTSFKVGLARETVFASDRYINAKESNLKENNFVSLRIKGEPKDASQEDIRGFYSVYNFEITEGADYAALDSLDTNKLYVKDTAEGKGKIPVTVKISAKYPKYSAFESYTTSYVSFFVTYGVMAGNYDELIRALGDQKQYVNKEGNVIETQDNPRVCTDNQFKVRASSNTRYAVCLENDIVFDASYRFTESKRPEIYGDLYGNNHMICADREQFAKDDNPMLAIEWSDVTVSNIILRANANEDAEINKETKTLRGHVLDIHATDMAKRYSFLNIDIEYSILENAATASHIFAAEVLLKGCIIRNMSNTGMYAAQRVRHDKEKLYILPVDLTLENMIFSNCLGTSFDFDTDLFEVSDRQNHDKYNFGDTKEESDEYIRNNLVTQGLTGSFTQKGFMDVYNWQCVDNLNIMSTGKEEFDAMIQVALSSVIGSDESLEPFRYRYKNADYFHLGFLIESMTGDLAYPLALKETVWMRISIEDERFTPFSISEIHEPLFRDILDKFGITIYAYKNDVALKPSATYVINDKLINKLHGQA